MPFNKLLSIFFEQDFITDEYRARVREVLQGALGGRETANFELPMFTKGSKVAVIMFKNTTY